jgi:hypothetical protein
VYRSLSWEKGGEKRGGKKKERKDRKDGIFTATEANNDTHDI